MSLISLIKWEFSCGEYFTQPFLYYGDFPLPYLLELILLEEEVPTELGLPSDLLRLHHHQLTNKRWKKISCWLQSGLITCLPIEKINNSSSYFKFGHNSRLQNSVFFFFLKISFARCKVPSWTCMVNVWLEKTRKFKFFGSLLSLTVCFHPHSWPFLWQPMHAKPTVHVGKNLGCFAVNHNRKARALFHLWSQMLSQVLMQIFTWT